VHRSVGLEAPFLIWSKGERRLGDMTCPELRGSFVSLILIFCLAWVQADQALKLCWSQPRQLTFGWSERLAMRLFV
jgi:hypothetical protein